jgi:hypothetical protein
VPTFGTCYGMGSAVMELRVLLAERVSTRGMTARGDAEVSRAGLVGLAGHETPRATRRYVKAHRASARIGSRLHPQAFRDDFLYTAGLDNPGLLAQVAEGTLVATSTGKTSGSCMRCFDQRLTSTGWSMKSRSRSISVLGWHAVRKMLRRRVSPVCQKRIKTRSPGRIFYLPEIAGWIGRRLWYYGSVPRSGRYS